MDLSTYGTRRVTGDLVTSRCKGHIVACCLIFGHR